MLPGIPKSGVYVIYLHALRIFNDVIKLVLRNIAGDNASSVAGFLGGMNSFSSGSRANIQYDIALLYLCKLHHHLAGLVLHIKQSLVKAVKSIQVVESLYEESASGALYRCCFHTFFCETLQKFIAGEIAGGGSDCAFCGLKQRLAHSIRHILTVAFVPEF